ncbi:MAG: hypothetical protein BTN85_0794 [Candidatus Methanohalarchaeum thermophilum]|uniref:Uncharacterized protein n=1 Tax=Methanohalarchaeum thermophilum TaxID=1903181 RepID=A0A1Q6DVC6_METT1|nr:MAG: hypothetical protein BTN85_0794 [Candidatus Methanohalarchaeum thermophilum]
MGKDIEDLRKNYEVNINVNRKWKKIELDLVEENE